MPRISRIDPQTASSEARAAIDDVPADMTAGMGNTKDRCIIALACPGSKYQPARFDIQYIRSMLNRLFHLSMCLPPGRVSRIGVSKAAALNLAKGIQHFGLDGRVGRVIQIYH